MNRQKVRRAIMFTFVSFIISASAFFWFFGIGIIDSYHYDIDPITTKIEEGYLQVGDLPFANSDAERLCLVYGGDMAKFMKSRDRELWFYGEYILLEQFSNGDEKVTRIPEHALISTKKEFCTSNPTSIFVSEVYSEHDRYSIRLDLNNGR